MARSSPRVAASAAAALLVLLAAAPSAHAATDCLGTLISANAACTKEIAALRDGKPLPATLGKACCAAAARVFSAGFGADCACAASVAPYRALLDGAQQELSGKCAGANIAELPACGAGRVAAAAVTPAAAPPAWNTGSVCTSQVCTPRCTPKNVAKPSTAQINRAKKCPANNGVCNGLGVSGATQGVTQCGTASVPIPDPENLGRTCFECCVARLAPTGTAKTGRNACKNPNPPRNNGCFPGSATVVTEGSDKPVALRDLKIGDKVLSANPTTGKTSFETVYFFGHNLPQATSEFVRLEVENGAVAMELTHKHLVPTLPGPVYKRAMDVVVGDVVLVADASEMATTREAQVTASSFVARSAGLFAPLTTGGGHIVVDGVVSSVHSNNMLDPLAEFLDRRDLLQWAYETFGASVLKTAYRLVGAEAMQKASPIVAGLGLGDAAQLAVGVRGLLLGQQPSQHAAKAA
jgi:hypothetical protein